MQRTNPMFFPGWIGVAVVALALVAASGCSSSSSDGSPDSGDDLPAGVQQLTIDASDDSASVYLDLATGELLALEDETAAESTSWHLAFRRFNIAVNGGTSGPGSAAGGLIGAQQAFYDEDGNPEASVFLNATPEQYLDVLMNDAYEEPEFVEDRLTTLFGDDWYSYNFVNGNIGANPDNGWLLRSGQGDSYARMRVTDIDFPTRSGEGVKHFEIVFDVQPADTGQFTGGANFSGSIPPEGGSICFDFDNDETVACEGTSWDVKLGFEGRDFFLRSNGGASGGGGAAALGPFPWSELEPYASATTDPGGSNLTSLYQPDTSSGIFDASAWYAYDLQGQHRLWPNYRVYLIDSDPDDEEAARFAVQIINYYSDTGASGHPTIRWRRLGE